METITTPKPRKYRNQKPTVDGIRFDSAKEARHYGTLKMMLKAGQILGFKRQVPYPIVINEIKVCTYVADFVVTHLDGRLEIQDPKGVKTPVYKLKQKLLMACYGLKIKEI